MERVTRIIRISSDELIGTLPGVQQLRLKAFKLLTTLASQPDDPSDRPPTLLISAIDLADSLVKACDAGNLIGIHGRRAGDALTARLLAPNEIDAEEMAAIVDGIRCRIAGVSLTARGHVEAECSLGGFGVSLSLGEAQVRPEELAGKFVKQVQTLGMSRLFQIFPSDPPRTFRNDSLYLFGKLLPSGEVELSVIELWSRGHFKSPTVDALIRASKPSGMICHTHDDDRLCISYPLMNQLTLRYEPLPQGELQPRVLGIIQEIHANPRVAGRLPLGDKMEKVWVAEFGCQKTHGAF